MSWTRWTAPAQVTTARAEIVAHFLEPVDERQIECEAQAAVAGIFKPIAIYLGAVVRSSREDQEQWLETTHSELDSLIATGPLRKAGLKA